MTLHSFFTLLPQFFTLLPAALLCYLPMRNQLRYSPARTAWLCLCFYVPYTVLATILCAVTQVDINLVLIPSFVLFFLFYHHTVRSGLSCTLAIFLGVCTLMSFPGQFAYGFDAWLHPASGAACFSLQAALFQFAVSSLFAAILAIPCARMYSLTVDRLPWSQIWYPFLAIHSILFLFNILMIPHSYETLYAGRAFSMFLALELVMLLLFLLLHSIFYRISAMILKHAQLMERSRFLEMQAGQYRTLQSYMQQTRQLRHDFRHSVHILSALAEDGNLEDLKAHLLEYEQQWDREVPVNYCENAALNALFNYYRGMADSAGVDLHWRIALPEPLTVSELDLASLFGNLMENAIDGCRTLPEGNRRFALSVEVQQENLYIVSTNTFNGQPKMNADGYRSTKHSGNGTGLYSISAIAEKHQGCARFSHTAQEFLADIVLRL